MFKKFRKGSKYVKEYLNADSLLIFKSKIFNLFEMFFEVKTLFKFIKKYESICGFGNSNSS